MELFKIYMHATYVLLLKIVFSVMLLYDLLEDTWKKKSFQANKALLFYFLIFVFFFYKEQHYNWSISSEKWKINDQYNIKKFWQILS